MQREKNERPAGSSNRKPNKAVSDNASPRKRHRKNGRPTRGASGKAGGLSAVGSISAGKKTVRKKTSGRVIALPKTQNIRRSDIHPLDRAITELRSELARTPDDATLLGRLGALFYRRGDLPEAEKHYRRAIELSPRRPTLYNNLGNVLCDMGRMRDGIAAYEHAIAMEKAADPTRGPSQEALVNLDLAKMEHRLVHERIEYLERASQLDVTSAEALNALGGGYVLRGQRMQALQTFRKAAAMDPRSLWAVLNIAYLHSLSLDGTTDVKEAQAEIAEAILRFPNAARLFIHQGELLDNAGLFEEAEERYLRAVKADPRFIEAYDLLGRVREVTGLTDVRDEVAAFIENSLQAMDEAARQNTIRKASLAEAQAHFDQALVQVARSRFWRRPLTQPTAVDTLLREAVHVAAAISGEESERAQELAVRASVLRAQLFEGEGRRDEARVILEQCNGQDAAGARLAFERGALALRSGDVEHAVNCFERATVASPQDALAYQSLRFAFEGFRRYKSERVRFESASKANPRDGLPHHHMALAALSILKSEEALYHFTRALELDPRLSDAACGRGRALQRLGHMEEAEAAYARALEIDPENGEAQRSLLAIRAQKLSALASPNAGQSHS
ncbi:MAG TPA: tetratricopeptide repeat protein [Planctomycetota bacterium]|nr:tetratricopeptide repeat protein [Planctomycetota bacterium]